MHIFNETLKYVDLINKYRQLMISFPDWTKVPTYLDNKDWFFMADRFSQLYFSTDEPDSLSKW